MPIVKKTVVFTGTTQLTQTLDLGAAFGVLLKLHLLSNTDVDTSVTFTDADGFVVATVASGDYTTKTQYFPTPVEATVFDSAGEVMTANGDASVGIACSGPLIGVAAGLDASETLTVDAFVRV